MEQHLCFAWCDNHLQRKHQCWSARPDVLRDNLAVQITLNDTVANCAFTG